MAKFFGCGMVKIVKVLLINGLRMPMFNLHKNPKQLRLALFISFIFIAGCYFLYRYTQAHPSTDNAYIQANTIYIAAQVSGPVTALNAANYQRVTKDSLLFEIDPKPYQLALDKARAELRLTEQQINANQAALATAEAVIKQRQAELKLTQKNAARITTLVKQGQLPKAQGDDAQSKLDIAKAALTAAQNQYQQAKQQLGEIGSNNAQLKAAQTAVQKAELDLQHTRITAPASGLIINLTSRIGSMINAGQPLFALIEDNVWWVDANFKETELRRIRPGQAATIKVDIYPGKEFQGIVGAISGGSGAAFSILPPENATGNWVKVTQRFPVKVLFKNPDAHFPLRVGASCEVTIDTTHLLKG